MLYNDMLACVSVVADAYKLLHVYQRPVPMGAEDIGAFEGVFNMIAYVAVVTNAGLAVFTLTIFDAFSVSSRMWLFVSFQYTCFLVMIFVQVMVPVTSEDCDIQVQRSRLLERKLIDRIPDEIITSNNNSNVDAAGLTEVVVPLDKKVRDSFGMLSKRKL
jgi:hypothetical protein